MAEDRRPDLKRSPELPTDALQAAEQYESRASSGSFRDLFEGTKTLCKLYLQTENMKVPEPLYGKFLIGEKTIGQFNPDSLTPEQYTLDTEEDGKVQLHPYTNTEYSCVEFRERESGPGGERYFYLRSFFDTPALAMYCSETKKHIDPPKWMYLMKIFAVALGLRKLRLEDGAKIPMKNGRFWNLRILNMLRSPDPEKERRPYYERFGFEAEKSSFQGDWFKPPEFLETLTENLSKKTKTFMTKNGIRMNVTALVDSMYDDICLEDPVIPPEVYKALEDDVVDKVEKSFGLRGRRVDKSDYKYNAYYSMDAPSGLDVRVRISPREDGESDVIIVVTMTGKGGRTQRRRKRKKTRRRIKK